MQIDITLKAMKSKYGHLIYAFDMVNEEDVNDGIHKFKDLIDEAKKTDPNLECCFHAGESVSSENSNMYDAFIIGSKRIGHGFNLALHPHLVEKVKEQDICLEVCPISNFVLGYTLDLRCHPARFLLNQGVQMSINSDDPGFWDYDNLTLDFAYVFIAWELTLSDLKKLVWNGVKYSSVTEEEKESLYKKLEGDWNTFVSSNQD